MSQSVDGGDDSLKNSALTCQATVNCNGLTRKATMNRRNLMRHYESDQHDCLTTIILGAITK